MTNPTRRGLFSDSVLQALKLGIPLAALPLEADAKPASSHDPARSEDPVGEVDTATLSAAGQRVESLAALKALTTRPPVVVMAGYRAAGDGGGGLFLWTPGSAIGADDILSVAPSGDPQGRYIRQGGDTVNVRWAGATGQGDVDDTAAFRTALAAGSTVYVPPGIYKLTDTLHLDGTTLVGTGPRSVLKCGHPGFDLLQVGGASCRVERLTIWGAATDQSTRQFGIITSTTSPPDDFAVSGVRFTGPDAATGLNNGMKFEDRATNCRVENNHFERLIGSAKNGYGILTGIVDGLVVTGNTFQGSRSAGQGRHAVYVSAGGRRVIASNNIVREFNCEALTTNAYAHQEPVEQLIFAHNVIYRCGGDGVNQSSISVTGRAKTIRVEGNIVVESFGCGILCDAGSVMQENISVDGNTIIDANYMGIRQLGALQQTVRNNYVRGSSRKKLGTWPDIVVGSGGVAAPEQILVSGNQCVPVTGVSGSPFVLNRSKPFPAIVKIDGNDFPSAGYRVAADYAPGVILSRIDGRIQFQALWHPPAVADKAIATASFAVSGAEPGDIVACSHPSAISGYILSASITEAAKVDISLANFSGASRALPAGLLRIDVWKRDSGEA